MLDQSLTTLWPRLGAVLGGGALLVALATLLGSLFSRRLAPGVAGQGIPRRSHYLALAAGFTLFVTYGAFLPLHYRPISLVDAARRFETIPFLLLGLGQERADWVATILLMAPVGFLWAAVLAVDERSPWFALVASLLAILGCVVLSFAIEFAQIWFPPRTVSQNDILAAVGGAVLGVVLWAAAGMPVTSWLREFTHGRTWRHQGLWLLRAYIVGNVLLAIVPMDFVIGWEELQVKFAEGQLDLVPFRAVWEGRVAWYHPVVAAITWIPLGFWTRWHSDAESRSRWGWWLLAGCCLVVAVEGIQVFVFSRYASVTNALMGCGGVCCGCALLAWWSLPSVARIREAWWRPFQRSPLPWVGLLVAGTGVVLLVATSPWDFSTDPTLIQPRFDGLWQPPLAALYWGSKFNAMIDIGQKLALMAPLGAIAARCVWPFVTSRGGRGLGALLGLAAVAAVGLMIELCQVFQASHSVDVSDAVVGAFGGAIGFYVTAICSRSGTPATRLSIAMVGLVFLAWIGTAAGLWHQVRDYCRANLPIPATAAQGNRGLSESDAGAGAAISPVPSTSPPGLATEAWPAVSFLIQAGGRFDLPPADPVAVPQWEVIANGTWTGATAIWGAVGTDLRGRVWVAVSVAPGTGASARLCEWLPESRSWTDCGNVLEELARAGLGQPGQSQSQIRSRIVTGADGNLYFASTDAGPGEDATNSPSRWGSHLWRYLPTTGRWEHLLAAPEQLTAVAAAADRIYAVSTRDPVIYQYHLRTGQVRASAVGSGAGSRPSRCLLVDEQGHVYVPRGEPRGDRQSVLAGLVEFDLELRAVHETPLDHPSRVPAVESVEIVAATPLADSSLVFLTDSGYLYRVRPQASGPARVEPVGWFHPEGNAQVTTLFSPEGQRWLTGLAQRGGHWEWLVFDLNTQQARVAPLPDSIIPFRQAELFGGGTLDRSGQVLLVGTGTSNDIQWSPELERTLRSAGATAADLQAVQAAAQRGWEPVVLRGAWTAP